ncbi:hypothetical protein DYB28_004428 [Aphanomyces astaci]|uniref:Methyltransferase type 11 domain-containing protein n=1 Tax=Aphanomyces astaci TaxID=112090 RepID=A0A9X8DJ49_APHAT|nr:hypothetical protein DYB28_004428 [Aphanomyces astaci]
MADIVHRINGHVATREWMHQFATDPSGFMTKVVESQDTDNQELVEPARVVEDEDAVQEDETRPDYPFHAFDKLDEVLHLQDRHPSAVYDIVEIGAGQGKLTKALKRVLPGGTRFAAVEPNNDRRTEFRHFVSDVPVFDGTASATTLPNESVGNIAIGHAFHCMAKANALDEFHRILVPNGRLGIMLNTGDFNSCPFMQDVERVVKSFNAAYVPSQPNHDQLQQIFHDRPHLFSPMQSQRIDTVFSASVDGIVDYLMSTCVMANLSHRRQTDVRLSIARLIEMNPDVTEDDHGEHKLELPCLVELHWVQKAQALQDIPAQQHPDDVVMQSC